jgi:hypothetical protein
LRDWGFEGVSGETAILRVLLRKKLQVLSDVSYFTNFGCEIGVENGISIE